MSPVPSTGAAQETWELHTWYPAVLGRLGACCQAGRQTVFNWTFCSCWVLSPKSKEQTASCTAQQGREPKVQCLALQTLPFSPGQADPTLEFPSFLPLLTSGLLAPPGKPRDFFSTLKESAFCYIGWMNISALPLSILRASEDRALSGRTHSRTRSKNFSGHISQKARSLE